MIKNIFLLLTALLTSYSVIYLSEKLFKGNRLMVFSKALAVVCAVAASAVAANGILPAAGLVFAMGPLPFEVAVLILSLSAAAYFCYYPLSSGRALRC
jgi:hypothetical protein